MKKAPAPRIAPTPMDFVLARVFDLYRELAAPARAAKASSRAASSREPRRPRETAQ